MADSEFRGTKFCGYCEKNVNSGAVCAKCDSSFHSSCAQTVKTCCEESICEKFQNDSEECLTSTDSRLAEENKLLRQIIQDKTAIIHDKEMVIHVLEEKIEFLEEKLKNITIDNQKQGNNIPADEKKTEAWYNKVRAVLNKLTLQKFETSVIQVLQLQIDNKERLQGLIDIVFEKATNEPSCSLVYAMLCKEIQNIQVSVGDENKNLRFRTLLVTRCQIEFEKQSVDETERNDKLKDIEECQDSEQKKELLFDLEKYDRRIRVKSVRTIRFIGELYKQRMLTASIMRRCLQTLLENKDEESLECLCQLLTTVGKELESKGIDLSSIFDEMKRTTEEKSQKASSRIRCMVRDVIDLRDSKWVPRNADTNPKSIVNIQKDAETEHLNTHVKNMNNPRRKYYRGGRRRGGGPYQKASDHGGSSVNTRNNHQPFSIQTEKVAKLVPRKGDTNRKTINNIRKDAETEHLNTQVMNKKNPRRKYYRGGRRRGGGPCQKASDDRSSSVSTSKNHQPFSTQTEKVAKLPLDEPLGSSQSFENCGKRAEGVKNQQSSINTTSSKNMYDNLENIDIRRRSLNSRGSKKPYSSKGPRVERSSYNNYGDWGSRSGSPSVPKLSEVQIEMRIRNSLFEFITGCYTITEYFQDISSTVPPSDYNKIVNVSYSYTLEKSQTVRLKTGELFAKLIKSDSISIEDFCKGFEGLLDSWEDLVIDMPQIWQYFAEDLIFLLLEEVLPFPRLQMLLDSLIQVNMAKELLKPLFSLVVKEKGPNFLQNSWQNSTLQLSAFMPASDVQSFVEENNLEFLLGGESPVGQSALSYEDIKNKLSELFHSGAMFDDVVNWISANVGNLVTDNKFIKTLATAIFKNSISSNKLEVEVLTGHTKLIQKYVDNNSDYELQCLYALQSLVHDLEYPQGLFLSICDKLYEDSTFGQESFIAWESSSDPAEQEGKDVALKHLTPFLTQLRENKEEDDYSSNSEDA